MKKKVLLFGISLGSFIGFLDIAIVNTVLASIQKSFNAEIKNLQWVMNSYLLFYCVFLTIMGKLSDLYGAKKMNALAVLLYGLSSLGAGLSPTIFWLIVSRSVQGLAMAMLIPSALALMAHLFQKKNFQKALGFWSAITGIGLALGPVLGGLFVKYLTWRWIFFINVPLSLTTLIIYTLIRENEKDRREKIIIDWKGFFLFSAGLFTLVFAIIESFYWLYPLAALFFIFFYFAENKEEPLIRFDFFTNKTYLSSAIGYFTLISCVFTGLFFIPLYLHNIMNQSTFSVGFLILPITLMVVLVSPWIERITFLLSIKKTILLGFIFLSLAFLSQLIHLTLGGLLIAYLFFGLGWALTFAPMKTAAILSVPLKSAGVAAGLLLTVDSFGGTVTLALSGLFFRKAGAGFFGYQIVFLYLAILSLLTFFLIALLMKKEKI